MKAVLWDGNKQINGQLKMTTNTISFKMDDFAETDLSLSIAYKDITRVEYYKVYNITTNGLQITSRNHKRNVFIVDDSIALKKAINENILSMKKSKTFRK